jgi:hypothetical protein
MRPGNRVIWLRSPGRSFPTGWRVQEIPGEIVRACRHRIRIRVRLGGSEALVIVSPMNVLWEDKAGGRVLRSSRRATQADPVAPGAHQILSALLLPGSTSGEYQVCANEAGALSNSMGRAEQVAYRIEVYAKASARLPSSRNFRFVIGG